MWALRKKICRACSTRGKPRYTHRRLTEKHEARPLLGFRRLWDLIDLKRRWREGFNGFRWLRIGYGGGLF